MTFNFFKLATKFIHPFTKVFTLFLLFFAIVFIAPLAHAAAGVNGQINIQGKLQNKSDSTNVADNTYTVVFTLYDAASGGTNLWTETQSVTTKDGVFFVALGSVNPLTSVNFNSDSLYLGIKVGSDAEMTPRIQFGSVPYAFNAQKVNGLTVTNTSDAPFSSATTLKIGDGKTVVFNNGLTFSGTDSTTFTFPNTTDTVVTQDFAQTLTNKTIGSTGLTFSGAATDITTGTNEDLTISPNGTGNTIFGNGYVGIGITNPSTYLQLSDSGQTATGKALAIFDQYENQDIFAASASGTTIFRISRAGMVQMPGTSQLNVSNQTSVASKFFVQPVGGTSIIQILRGSTAGQTADLLQFQDSNGVVLSRFASGGNLGIGTSVTTPFTALHVASASAGKALAVFDQLGAGNDIFTASASGTPRFVINYDGNVGIGASVPATHLHVADSGASANGKALAIFDQYESQDIFTASASGTPKFTIARDGTFTAAGYTVAGGVLYTNGSGLVQQVAAGSLSNQCLVGGNGATPAWGSCGSGTSLFTDAGSFTYLNSTTDDLVLGASTTSAAAFWLQVTNGSSPASTTLSLGTDGSKNAILKLFSTLGAGKASTISTDSSGNLNLAAASGSTVVVGSGNGNVQMSLTNAADLFAADKTVTLGSSYSNNDFTFKRVLTGGTNAQGGSVLYVTDVSGGSGTINPDLILANAALTSGTFTGNLLRLQVGGADKFLVDSNGNAGIGTTSPNGLLNVNGAATGKALVEFNQTGDQAVLTASVSGTPVFTINNIGMMSFTPSAGGPLGGQVFNFAGSAAAFGGDFFLINAPSNNSGNLFDVQKNGVGKLVVSSTGNVGIGTTSPKGALDVQATSGTTSVASVSGATSFAGLVVDNSGVGDIFTASSSGTTRFVVKQSGVVQIGNTTDGLTFDYLNGGPTYAGKARPMKTITLSPEYAGAALTQFYGAGTDTSNITGTMTSDASTSAGLRTHYSWTSSTASPLQSYTVAVRVTLPQDFSQWCTTSVGCSNTNALQIDYDTLGVSATQNDLNVYIYNSSNTSTAVYTSTGNVVGSLDGWGTLSIQKASLEGTQTWNTAGQTAIIYLRMQAMNNYHVLLGDIKLNYLAKF